MLLRAKETCIEQDDCTTNEIYYVAYNSFYRDHKALFHVMNLQENYICRPFFSKRSICVSFHYTHVNNEVMRRFWDQLEKCKDYIDKVAIVGVPVNARAIFTVKSKYKGSELARFQFFTNTESAVHWLNKQ